MLALAFECAGQGLNAALAEDGHVLLTEQADMDRGQPAALLPLLHKMFEQADRRPTQLDRLAVTRGPGGFTGIRLGLSVALGLCRATGAAFYGVNAFDVYAAAQPSLEHLGLAIESRRAELFLRGYDGAGKARGGDQVCTPDQFDRGAIRRFVGSAAAALDPQAQNQPPDMALVAAKLSQASLADDWLLQSQDQCAPLYLREPEIGSPKPK